MAPMWTNEASSTNSTIWIVTSLGFLTTMVTIWTVCACCYRKKQRKEADAPTHGESEKKLTMDRDSESMKRRTSINQSLDLETSENSLSDGSFPTVFEMQLKRSKKRHIKKESDPDRSKSTKSTVESRKEAAAKRSMMVGNVSSSISVSLTSLQSCKSDQKSISRSESLATARTANSKSTSNGKLAVQSLFVVVIGLLLVPASAKTVVNTQVADIGLGMCVENTVGHPNDAQQFLTEFRTAFVEQWPIGNNGMRIAIGEWIDSSTTIRLSIAEGGNKGFVKATTLNIGRTSGQNRTGWDDETRFRHDNSALRRNFEMSGDSRRPKVFIGFTLLRRQSNDYAHVESWKISSVNAAWRKLRAFSDAARMDQYVIYEVASNGFAAIFNHSSAEPDCFSAQRTASATALAVKMLDAIQVHLRSCPLEVNERCYLDDNDNCKANITYTPKPTAPENRRFCWNRPPDQRDCSDPNAPECPKKPTPSPPIGPSSRSESSGVPITITTSTSTTTGKSNTTKTSKSTTTSKSIKTSPTSSPDVFEPSINTTAFNTTTDAPIGGFIFSAWFGCSIVALIICFIVIVINVYRQCSAFIKHKRQRKQELAEMGMVLTASRRATRKGARKRVVYSKVQPTYVKLSPKPKPSKRQ